MQIPSPKAVDPYSEMSARVERPTAGFTDLKQAIFTCFDGVAQVVAKDVRENEYLCEMIALAHQLLLFGLYDNGVEPGKHHDGTCINDACLCIYMPVIDRSIECLHHFVFRCPHPR